MSPETQERVNKVQARLNELGLRDIKITWSETAHLMTSDERANSLCDFVESYLDGNFTPMPPFGDASERLMPSEV
jgi:hypothetical protein